MFVTRVFEQNHYTRDGRSAMKDLLIEFLRDESGTTAIEYGLFAASIAVAIITVVQGFGSKLKTIFAAVQNALN
jgi:pilus assembly protein Flp/PilA